ncbi:UDP-N-acetylglucosamine 2-epimerase (non-hydrolyzing) [Rhodopseudomonas palustris]|nr:UDP-N-acetylglucosamine 2-epimerase (non-hydrolyzing) [Rhodopseudomonas palustris]
MPKKILCVAGTRPEVIKMAPLIIELRQKDWTDVVVVASGQHRELSNSAFDVFGIVPDFNLDVMTANQTLSQLTAKLFIAFDGLISEQAPDLVVVQGDTTTVMVVATVCFYLGVPVGHLEAGLRTGNIKDPFPEEFNRVVCGKTAALHFAPTQKAYDALRADLVPAGSIILTGNTVIDALMMTAGVPPTAVSKDKRLILLTAHRRENFGQPLRNVFSAVKDVVEQRNDIEVLYPVHPNPNVKGLAEEFFWNVPRVHLCAPLGYDHFVGAMRRAFLIVSDSGGVQEEAPALGKPVLVTRRETERPEAVAAGVARLVGTDYESVRSNIEMLLDSDQSYARMSIGCSPYGDGKASSRVADAIKHFLGLSATRELDDFSFQLLRNRA